jgi:hypothetical protein
MKSFIATVSPAAEHRGRLVRHAGKNDQDHANRLAAIRHCAQRVDALIFRLHSRNSVISRFATYTAQNQRILRKPTQSCGAGRLFAILY